MTNASDPPPGPRAKIERAKKHFRDLGDEIQSFHDGDPYTIIREPDPEGGWRARLDPWPEIPAEIALTFGDCIHNLRSSLDILVCDLVREHRPQDLSDWAGFPIVEYAEALKTEIPRQVKGAPNPVQQAIVREKPYKRGNETLWQLHRLDILDKHRLILPTVVANEAVNVGKMMSQQMPPLPRGGEVPEIDLWIRSASPCDEEGGVVFRDKSGSEPDYDLELRFNIAVHEPGLVECEPILPFASHLGEVVESTVANFDQFF